MNVGIPVNIKLCLELFNLYVGILDLFSLFFFFLNPDL